MSHSLVLLQRVPILFMRPRSLGGVRPTTCQPNSYKYSEMLSGDSVAVMEHTGEDRDEFRRDVTMTGQRAIFCSESLTVPHLVTLYKHQRRGPEGTLTDRLVEDSKKKTSQLSKSSISWPDGCVGCVLLCLCGQPDRDRRTKAAEETAGPWHGGAPQPSHDKEILTRDVENKNKAKNLILFLKVHRVKIWPGL